MRHLFIIFTAIFITACVPKTHIISPAIEGKVIDAQTKYPISGVRVGSTLTDKDGKFYIEANKELGVGTTMGGVWRLPAMVVKVEKAGYKPDYYICDALNTQEGCFDVVIKLYRLEK